MGKFVDNEGLKILQYAPNYLPATRYGGPIRSSHGLARGLVALGHEVEVFTTNVDGPDLIDTALDTPVTIDGVRVCYFDVEPPRRLYYAPRMSRALEARLPHFDIAHVNGVFLWPGPRAAHVARKSGIPYVVSPRGMLVPELIAGKSRLAKLAWIEFKERRALACAAAVHVTSQAEADGVRRLGLDLAPLAVIGNGVDAPHRAPDQAEIESVWRGIPRGGRVAFLGRLDWTKGVDLAIAAVAQHANARLLIAGHDQIGLRAALTNHLGACARPQCATFIGPLEDAAKWAFLAGADVLLAPSVKESFGMAVAEALAIGTPVICSEGVGAGSIVRRIDPGCVVPRHAQALGAALDRLLADAPRRTAYAARSVELMATEYTWFAIARQMAGLYESVRARRASSLCTLG